MPITKHPRTGRYIAGADRLIKATMSDPVDEGGPKKRKKLMDDTSTKITRGNEDANRT